MKPHISTRIFRDSDETPLVDLMKVTFGFSKELWRWKHRLYPNFTPASITVAENDGRIVGTSSWIPRELKISSALAIKSALGGDTAVDPRFRGQGVGSTVMHLFYKEALNNGVIAVSGFATPEVARKFYGPLGSILMRDSTTTYVRLMNCSQFQQKTLLMDTGSRDQKTSSHSPHMVIEFILNGAPPFLVNVRNGKINLEEIKESLPTKPNVTLEGELSLVIPFLKGEKGVWGLAKLILKRKLRTKGVLRNAIKLFKTRAQMKRFLSSTEE